MTDSFNLCDEPWVRVRDKQGHVTELSLREVFAHGNEYAALAGEIPTQDVAVLRLLLAIIMRAMDLPGSDEERVDLWDEWWGQRKLPTEEINAYLERWHGRFDLLDAATPFMQVADLSSPSGRASGLVKLIAEVPDGNRFFTLREGAGLDSLTFAEAARWLVHCQAYDMSGIKTGAVGDTRVKSGRGYPIGQGLAGWLGVVIAEGNTITETLLLNLCLDRWTSDDSVVWERSPQGPEECVDHPVPVGVSDMYTWQARRVRLFTKDSRIIDVQLSNGDRPGLQNMHRVDTMSAWRFSAPQSKKFGHDVLMPKTHQPERTMWRGLESMLVKNEDPQRGQRPAVIEWEARLVNEEVLDPNYSLTLRAIGIEYGPQSASIARVIDDEMSANVAAITDPALIDTINSAVQSAAATARCVAFLADNLGQAAGAENEGEHDRAYERAYGVMDPLFRDWTRTLRKGADTTRYERAWQCQVAGAVTALGVNMCRSAGRKALVGRQIQQGDRVILRDTAQCWHVFMRGLYKALPLAYAKDAMNNSEAKEGD
ncbi:casA_cse1: CRISPR type I-E/ECOLI-associated protein CasA/Cse1 [Propionibacterium australiense]|uniref:CasA_cse1: CRISPR type I-E/ECOLI-associated protein CasA/Cse1 n=1 Tax=Propionibacterium australiense TaxID=119981 RepID=A0A383S9I9_9ACTN|nr:type I-E CRISPR-associated protein Cse1/CasA [Propionibacterium australiense]SYZ34084.1 casA_cse1: CRISPR type I-E/ECOLI-associated protein CasA/Cse1 [Propionibacterium australiense]